MFVPRASQLTQSLTEKQAEPQTSFMMAFSIINTSFCLCLFSLACKFLQDKDHVLFHVCVSTVICPNKHLQRVDGLRKYATYSS